LTNANKNSKIYSDKVIYSRQERKFTNTCLDIVKLAFVILKQIQIQVLDEFKQIVFVVKLFDLDYSDLFIVKYLVNKRVKWVIAKNYSRY